MKLAPSILSADFAQLGREIEKVAENGADYIHIDVMDGHFVPNITIGPPVVESLRKICTLPLDVHLMIEEPDRYVEAFSDAGADIITIHAESTRHLHRSIQKIKDLGKKAGVALNPATPLAEIEYILNDIDMVLLMTVNPGFGAQKFINEVIPKIQSMRSIITSKALNIDIEIDGGITPENIYELTKIGANVIVAGSSIFKSDDIAKTMSLFRERAYR